MKRVRLSGLECFGRSPSRFARAKHLRRAFCAALLSMISSLWICTPFVKATTGGSLSFAGKVIVSVVLPRSFKGASRGINPPFLRRRDARKLPHHGVESRGEQEAEQRHAEHPEEHGGAERLAHFSASAGRDCERNHAQDERQRGHQDRPQASTGGLNGC